MKDMIWLVDMALDFVMRPNETGSWIIHEFKGFQFNWPICNGRGSNVIKI
jgi:hypothetical protein